MTAIALVIFVAFSFYQYMRAEKYSYYRELVKHYEEDIKFWQKYSKQLEEALKMSLEKSKSKL